jgi:hypothetical protein
MSASVPRVSPDRAVRRMVILADVARRWGALLILVEDNDFTGGTASLSAVTEWSGNTLDGAPLNL